VKTLKWEGSTSSILLIEAVKMQVVAVDLELGFGCLRNEGPMPFWENGLLGIPRLGTPRG
jgi:hypothetical protein